MVYRTAFGFQQVEKNLMGSAQTLKKVGALSALMYSIYFWFGESGEKKDDQHKPTLHKDEAEASVGCKGCHYELMAFQPEQLGQKSELGYLERVLASPVLVQLFIKF